MRFLVLSFYFLILLDTSLAQSFVFTQASGSPLSLNASMRGAISQDVNADGKLDLLVTSANSNYVYVSLGNGSGQFSPAPGSQISVNSQPTLSGLQKCNEFCYSYESTAVSNLATHLYFLF